MEEQVNRIIKIMQVRKMSKKFQIRIIFRTYYEAIKQMVSKYKLKYLGNLPCNLEKIIVN